LIVIDASAGIDWLLQTPDGNRIDRYISTHDGCLNEPQLIDIEVADSLRRLARLGLLSPLRADQAISFLQALPITRHSHTDLLPRIWRHRHILLAHGATYVALAETLDAMLITRDARLASAQGHTAKIKLF
jgi:predicted nucleic acid-binding protein